MGMTNLDGHYFDIGIYDAYDYTDKFTALCSYNNEYNRIPLSTERIITAACTLAFDDETYAGELTFKLDTKTGMLYLIGSVLLDNDDNEIFDLHGLAKETITQALENDAQNELSDFIARIND